MLIMRKDVQAIVNVAFEFELSEKRTMARKVMAERREGRGTKSVYEDILTPG